jgi:hypothetical protein
MASKLTVRKKRTPRDTDEHVEDRALQRCRLCGSTPLLWVSRDPQTTQRTITAVCSQAASHCGSDPRGDCPLSVVNKTLSRATQHDAVAAWNSWDGTPR